MRPVERSEIPIEASSPSSSRDGSTRVHVGRHVSMLAASLIFAVGLVAGAQAASTEHLVVTADGLVTQAEQLRDHRIRTGMSSSVVTMTEVVSAHPTAASRAIALRKFLQREAAGGGLEYVVLMGDVDEIPSGVARSSLRPIGGHTDIPTDLYYMALDGSWNDDGDAYWAEADLVAGYDGADLTPNIIVGRIPARTAEEATAVVDNIIAYETSASATNRHRILGTAEVIFPQHWSSGEDIYMDGAALLDTTLTAAEGCRSGASHLVEKLYENFSAFAGSDSSSSHAVLDSLSSGQFGVWAHLGHGHFFNVSTGTGSIVADDVRVLRQSESRFVVLSVNCAANALDVDSLFKTMMRLDDGGAVACIGATRSAFPEPAAELQNAILEAMYCGTDVRLGDAFRSGLEVFGTVGDDESLDRWTLLGTALLGDPGMRVWTHAPVASSVQVASSISADQDYVTATVTDGGGAVEGATVAVSSSSGLLGAGTTNSSGVVTISLETTAGITLTVDAMGPTILPSTATTVVSAASALDTRIVDVVVDDQTGGSIVGNGDGELSEGERVGVSFVLAVDGQSVAGGSLGLSSADSQLSVVTTSTSFGAVSAGGQTTVGPFLVDGEELSSVRSTVELDVKVSVTGVGATDDVTLELSASRPALRMVALDVDDDAQGDGDGIIESGETVTLIPTVRNDGGGASGSATISIVTPGPAGVTIVDGQAALPSVDVNGQLTASDGLVVTVTDPSAVLTLSCVTALGVESTFAAELSPPQSPSNLAVASVTEAGVELVWDPTGAASYMVERSIDGSAYQTVQVSAAGEGAYYQDASVATRTDYWYRVSSVSAIGTASAPSSAVKATTPPPELACFPFPVAGNTSGSLAVTDWNQDGTLDALIPMASVVALGANCREVVDGDNNIQTTGPMTDYEGQHGPASVALGEFDSSSEGLELVVPRWDDPTLAIYRSDGALVSGWPVQLIDKCWGSPVVGDIDGDGYNEVVINDVRGWTYAFNHDGTEVVDGDSNPSTVGPLSSRRQEPNYCTGTNHPYEVYGRTTPALHDVDGDGKLEVVFGSKFSDSNQSCQREERFYALKADGTGNATGWPKVFAASQRAAFVGSPVIADFDADGEGEILAQSENDSLYCWNGDGTRVPGFPVHIISDAVDVDLQCPSPAVAEMQGPGNGYHIATVETESRQVARVHVLDAAGQALSGWPQDLPTSTEASPVVADITGDGQLDVVIGTGGGTTDPLDYIYAWTADGQLIPGFPIKVGGPVRATPTVCDFNGDGLTNLVLASWDQKLHVWDLESVFDPAAAPWPTFRGSNARTGVVAEGLGSSIGSPVGSIFLSFSETSMQSEITGLSVYQPFSWYVRADVDFGDINRSDLNATAGVGGWEGAVSLPAGVVVTSRQLVPASSLDLDSGADAFSVGFGSCTPVSSGDMTFVQYTGVLTSAVTDGVIRLAQPLPSSYARSAMGPAPGFIACDAPTDLYPFQPSWASSRLVINPSGQPVEPIVTASALVWQTISQTIVSVLLDHDMTVASLETEANYEVWPTGSPGTTYTPSNAAHVSGYSQNWVLLVFDTPLPGGVGYSITVDDLETTDGHTMTAPYSTTVYDAGATEDLVISEIMWNPAVKSDAEGEWFEVFNRSGTTVDIRGMTLASGTGETHVVTAAEPIYIPAQAYRVLCRDREALLDQGVDPVYEYGDDLTFADSADEIRITSATGSLLDHVAWDTSSGWPSVNGYSVQWTGTPANDSPGEWTSGGPAFGLGDHGTPGRATESATSAPPVRVTRTELLPSVPNPFNPRTEVRFSLARPGHVMVAVFDVRGRRVASVVDEYVEEAGTVSRTWNGTDAQGRGVASGVYLVRMWVDAVAVGGHKVALVR